MFNKRIEKNMNTYALIEFLDHSNRIEGVYDGDSLNVAKNTWDYLIGQDYLSVNRILETHKTLMKGKLHKDVIGHFRDCDVFVGGKRCPHYTLVSGMLHDWVRKYGKAKTEEEIKLAHIRFEQIHPFVDGNGRVGRILLNWQRIKAKLPILVIEEGYEQREYYKWFKE